jgi:hypothetical protein
MADVWQLAESKSELPVFAGATINEQLANGQAEAARRLAKYVGTLEYSASDAEAILHQVSSWVERERPDLEAALAGPGSAQLPEQVALELGVDRARQFVVASYAIATRTLGPWLSGAVYRGVASGELNQVKMEEDGRARLSIYASIVKWDDDGDLATIFAPKPMAGLPPIVVGGIIVAVLIGLAITAAGIIHWVNSSQIVRRNVDLFDALCKDAQAKGDQQTTTLCLQLSAGIQKTALEEETTVGTIAKWAAIVAISYVGVRFVVMPMLQKRGWA